MIRTLFTYILITTLIVGLIRDIVITPKHQLTTRQKQTKKRLIYSKQIFFTQAIFIRTYYVFFYVKLQFYQVYVT